MELPESSTEKLAPRLIESFWNICSTLLAIYDISHHLLRLFVVFFKSIDSNEYLKFIIKLTKIVIQIKKSTRYVSNQVIFRKKTKQYCRLKRVSKRKSCLSLQVVNYENKRWIQNASGNSKTNRPSLLKEQDRYRHYIATLILGLIVENVRIWQLATTFKSLNIKNLHITCTC